MTFSNVEENCAQAELETYFVEGVLVFKVFGSVLHVLRSTYNPYLSLSLPQWAILMLAMVHF